MQPVLELYQVSGGIFFYIYILIFAFKKGKLNKANPLLMIPFANTKMDHLLNNIIKHINIFPSWALFLGLKEDYFSDLLVQVEMTNGKKYEWVLCRDLRVGALILKNKFFIHSMVSHYSSFKRSIDLIIKKSIKKFAHSNNEEVDCIKIYNADFKFPVGEKNKKFKYEEFNKNPGVEKFPIYIWKKRKKNITAERYDII